MDKRYFISILTFVFLLVSSLMISKEAVKNHKEVMGKLDLCGVYFNQEQQSISAIPSKVIPHKGVRPNRIIIECGEVSDEHRRL